MTIIERGNGVTLMHCHNYDHKEGKEQLQSVGCSSFIPCPAVTSGIAWPISIKDSPSAGKWIGAIASTRLQAARKQTAMQKQRSVEPAIPGWSIQAMKQVVTILVNCRLWPVCCFLSFVRDVNDSIRCGQHWENVYLGGFTGQQTGIIHVSLCRTQSSVINCPSSRSSL